MPVEETYPSRWGINHPLWGIPDGLGETENLPVRLGRVVLRTCSTLRRWSRYGGPIGPVYEATLRAPTADGYSRRGVERIEGRGSAST